MAKRGRHTRILWIAVVLILGWPVPASALGGAAPSGISISAPSDGEFVFSSTQVSAAVSPVTAVGSVDFLVDGVLVGSTPIVAGVASFSWDTSSSADGLRMLELQARGLTGPPVATAAVEVQVANGLNTAARLSADLAAERITLPSYVELGITSLMAEELLPTRYQTSQAISEEATALVIEYLQHWGALDPAIQLRLGNAIDAAHQLDFAYMAELLGGSPGSGSQVAAVDDWPECVELPSGGLGLGVYVRCTHASERFVIAYTVESASAEDGVAEEDKYSRAGSSVTLCDPVDWGNCNLVPDYVDRVAAALEHGWDTYENLEFVLPPNPAKVAIEAGRARVVPTKLEFLGTPIGFWEPTIVLNNTSNYFSTARHELFHLFQYEYVSLDQIPSQSGVWAWLEASAQWGAHQAARVSDNVGVAVTDGVYYDRLGAVLSRPNWWALAFEDDFSVFNSFRSQRRQYGTFLLAEHLEEHLDAPGASTTVVERTWELIGEGATAPAAIGRVVEENSPDDWTLGELLADYHLDSYILTDVDPLGFLDPDADEWRQKLSSPPFGSGISALPDERPAAVTHDFDAVGEVWDPADTERLHVVAGGAEYVLMNLLDEDGVPLVADLVVDVPAIEEIASSLVLFDGYPNLCSVQPASFRIDAGPGTAASIVLPLQGACDEAVLILSHTGLVPGPQGDLAPGVLGNGVQVDWTARIEGGFANLAFEEGDLRGWLALPNNPGTTFTVTPDGESGAADPYAAHITIPNLALGTEELSRVVFTAGVTEATVAVSGTAGAKATFEVIGPSQTNMQSVVLTGPGNWVPLTFGIFANVDVTVRLIADPNGVSGPVDVAFDGVYMYASG